MAPRIDLRSNVIFSEGYIFNTEAVTGGVLYKKVNFLEISLEIHRKTPVPESLFNKVAGLGLW